MSRIEAHRIVLGTAWNYFEAAATRGEDRAKRTITWGRRIAGIAVLFAGWRALRRPLPAEVRRRNLRLGSKVGLVARTMGTLATLQKFNRLLRLAAGWASPYR